MKILIVDHDARSAHALTRLIRRIRPGATLDVVHDVRRAFSDYQVEQPDVVFIDVSTSGRKGGELCRRIVRGSRGTAVILYGNASQDACHALEHGAVDYLLKPLEDDRVGVALRRASIMISGMTQPSRVAESVAMRGAESFLTSRLHGDLKLIPLSDVYALRAEDKYVTALHRNGEDLLDEPLCRLEARYGDAHFIRVHRNGLVARRQIRALRSDGQHQHHVLLQDGETFKVSRRHVGTVRNYLLGRANIG